MSPFHSVLTELLELRSRFQGVTNTLWLLKGMLAASYQAGHQDTDFLPRRLTILEKESLTKFKELYAELEEMIEIHLADKFFIFNSKEDVETMRQIAHSIRYIYNAFAGVPPVGQTLARLEGACLEN